MARTIGNDQIFPDSELPRSDRTVRNGKPTAPTRTRGQTRQSPIIGSICGKRLVELVRAYSTDRWSKRPTPDAAFPARYEYLITQMFEEGGPKAYEWEAHEPADVVHIPNLLR